MKFLVVSIQVVEVRTYGRCRGCCRGLVSSSACLSPEATALLGSKSNTYRPWQRSQPSSINDRIPQMARLNSHHPAPVLPADQPRGSTRALVCDAWRHVRAEVVVGVSDFRFRLHMRTRAASPVDLSRSGPGCSCWSSRGLRAVGRCTVSLFCHVSVLAVCEEEGGPGWGWGIWLNVRGGVVACR